MLLVLEDLDAAGYPIRLNQVNSKQIAICLKWLAEFHATFMGSESNGLWDTGTYWHLATRPEELEALDAAGLQREVIPGITAASGCAAAAGIPLTHRNTARTVSFVTATTADNEPQDWTGLTNPQQTLAIYMGISKLPAICTGLIAAGKPADHPAAIIENGTTERQRLITGTLTTISAQAEKAKIVSPAILLVGTVTEMAGLADTVSADTVLSESPESSGWSQPANRIQT